MKKTLTLIGSLLAIALMLASCKKGSDLFAGSYSYKTTGNLYAINVHIDTFNVDNLLVESKKEIGQLRINKINSDSLMLTLSPLTGDNRYVYGKVSGDSIYLSPRTITKGLRLNGQLYYAQLQVTGKGRLYDNQLVLTENYIGNLGSINQSLSGTLMSNEVLTLAERNKE